MDIYRYFICFVLYSFLGWLYESMYYTVRYRKPVNTGFLNVCLCPIYGIGALLDVALLGGIEDTWKLFFAGMILTCTLEYMVSWLMEEIFHTRWWDYSEWPFNIRGRVCLLGGLAFGIFTVFLIKMLHPAAVGYISQMHDRTVHFICGFALMVIFTDVAVTVRNSDKFEKKLWFVPSRSEAVGSRFVSRQRRAAIQHIKEPRFPEILRRLIEYINNR